MSEEIRKFVMHQALLVDVIRRQAGTLSKAVLEAVMNAVDAKAKTCRVTLSETTVDVVDDGQGFGGRDAIVKFFEVFGQPHAKEEEKVYGTFRMGRGQLFAFGRNLWESGGYSMDVDIDKAGLDYRLKPLKRKVSGCRVHIDLYQKLCAVDRLDIARSLTRMLKYAPIVLTIDGETVSEDPAKEDWTVVTDDAYIRLDSSSYLAVYNLGVHVCDLGNYRYGTGGVVVSKKPLVVNFARNDVMASECKVWARVVPEIDKRATKDNKGATVLNDGARQRLVDQLICGAFSTSSCEAARLKLFTDVSGRNWSLQGILRKAGTWKLTVAKQGDTRGDRIQQTGQAFVLSDSTLLRFHVKTVDALVALLRKHLGMYRESLDKFKPVEFDKLAAEMSSEHKRLAEKELTSRERVWLMLLRRAARAMRVADDDSLDDTRDIGIGVSSSMDAWTDGDTYIVVSRHWLQDIEFDLVGVMRAVFVLLHEFCHTTEDTSTHVHGAEFYQRFHDARAQAIEAGSLCISLIPGLLRTEGRRMSRATAVAMDKLSSVAAARELAPAALVSGTKAG